MPRQSKARTKTRAKTRAKPSAHSRAKLQAKSPKDVGRLIDDLSNIYESTQRIVAARERVRAGLPPDADLTGELKRVADGVKSVEEAALARVDLETEGMLSAKWLHNVLGDVRRAGEIAKLVGGDPGGTLADAIGVVEKVQSIVEAD